MFQYSNHINKQVIDTIVESLLNLSTLKTVTIQYVPKKVSL